jgi:hypothetical protein
MANVGDVLPITLYSEDPDGEMPRPSIAVGTATFNADGTWTYNLYPTYKKLFQELVLVDGISIKVFQENNNEASK